MACIELPQIKQSLTQVVAFDAEWLHMNPQEYKKLQQQAA
jgi:hypothetical protein